MRLETNRLTLRELSLKDANDLAKHGHEKIMPYFTWYIPFPFTVPKARKIIRWLNRESAKKNDGDRTYAFGIVVTETKEVIGVTDLYDVSKKHKKAKIGYWIGKQQRGKGLASEAVMAVLSLAFKRLHLNKVSAETLVDNDGSNKLLTRAGFKKVGVKRKDRVIDGLAKDVILWERLRS